MSSAQRNPITDGGVDLSDVVAFVCDSLDANCRGADYCFLPAPSDFPSLDLASQEYCGRIQSGQGDLGHDRREHIIPGSEASAKRQDSETNANPALIPLLNLSSEQLNFLQLQTLIHSKPAKQIIPYPTYIAQGLAASSVPLSPAGSLLSHSSSCAAECHSSAHQFATSGAVSGSSCVTDADGRILKGEFEDKFEDEEQTEVMQAKVEDEPEESILCHKEKHDVPVRPKIRKYSQTTPSRFCRMSLSFLFFLAQVLAYRALRRTNA
jgi:hypothetical protein